MRVSEPSHIPAACAALATASRKPPDGAKRPESFRCESMRFGAIRNFFCVESNVFQHAGGGMYIFTVPCHCPRSPQRPAVRRICPWRDEWQGIGLGKNPEAPFHSIKPMRKLEFVQRSSRMQAGNQCLTPCLTLTPCIFVIVLLGRLERESQAGVLRPVATGRRKARVRTLTPRIRFCVMRRKARSTCAHCPKLEPLLEHDNHKSS